MSPRRTARRAPRRVDSTRQLAIACARAADDKLAERTVVLDLTGLGFVSDYILITSASSPPHCRAVAEAVEDALREHGAPLHHREGDHSSPWMLLDCHNLIVHIFDEPTRRHYDLERLWAEAKRVNWKPRAASRRKSGGTRPRK